MEQRFTLGRGLRREMAIGRASNSAISAPSPRDGEIIRTALPDTFDGIRFEIGRMIRYVQDAAKDPIVLSHTAEICSSFANEAEAKLQMNGGTLAGTDPRHVAIQAIDNWCREHFVYVNDPPNIEVLQTPRRMIKATKVPPDVLRSIIEPFYEAMYQVAPQADVDAYEPPGLCVGDCDEAGDLYLSQCATIPCPEPMDSLGFRFGGHDGTLHHVWAYVGCGDKMFDGDLTEPGYKLGDFSKFSHYEEVKVSL